MKSIIPLWIVDGFNKRIKSGLLREDMGFIHEKQLRTHFGPAPYGVPGRTGGQDLRALVALPFGMDNCEVLSPGLI